MPVLVEILPVDVVFDHNRFTGHLTRSRCGSRCRRRCWRRAARLSKSDPVNIEVGGEHVDAHYLQPGVEGNPACLNSNPVLPASGGAETDGPRLVDTIKGNVKTAAGGSGSRPYFHIIG